MILLIRTNETAENIAVFYYGGHGFGKKSAFWRPHGVGGALCVMCCATFFFARVVCGRGVAAFFVVCAGWPGARPIV